MTRPGLPLSRLLVHIWPVTLGIVGIGLVIGFLGNWFDYLGNVFFWLPAVAAAGVALALLFGAMVFTWWIWALALGLRAGGWSAWLARLRSRRSSMVATALRQAAPSTVHFWPA